MDASTISTATFRVTDNGVAVPGTVSYDAPSRVASFVVTSATGFAASRPFVATIASGTAGVKDLAGNAPAADRVWGPHWRPVRSGAGYLHGRWFGHGPE